MVSAHAAAISTAKSRSPTASMAVRGDALEAELVGDPRLGRAAASIPQARRCRAEARRMLARAAPEPHGIAGEHLHVGEQVMRQRHHLRALQVRVAGHRAARCSQRAHHERLLEPRNRQQQVVHARRAHMRRSVATWSLRLRPVCSIPATGPTSSKSRRSTAVWMSSSLGATSNASLDSSRATARAPRRSPDAARCSAGRRRAASARALATRRRRRPRGGGRRRGSTCRPRRGWTSVR